LLEEKPPLILCFHRGIGDKNHYDYAVQNVSTAQSATASESVPDSDSSRNKEDSNDDTYAGNGTDNHKEDSNEASADNGGRLSMVPIQGNSQEEEETEVGFGRLVIGDDSSLGSNPDEDSDFSEASGSTCVQETEVAFGRSEIEDESTDFSQI
jgi:hypothetical protein